MVLLPLKSNSVNVGQRNASCVNAYSENGETKSRVLPLGDGLELRLNPLIILSVVNDDEDDQIVSSVASP